MKKVLALAMCFVMVFVLTGCKDYVNRDYTADYAAMRFDGLFDRIADVMEKHGIQFDRSKVVSSDDEESIVRSYDGALGDGTILSIWLTYSFHEDETGTETFYCSIELPQCDSLENAYPDAKNYRYFFETGHLLSNMWGTGKSIREANNLVELIREEIGTAEGTPSDETFKKSVELNEKYDLWDIGYSLKIDKDGKCSSVFTYEGLVNV